jgi:hypothetical protein
MAWHNKFPLSLTALALTSAALVAGCNVGKTDVVTTTTSGGTTTTTSSGARTCKGAYVGAVNPPEQSVRLANRDRQLAEGGPLGGGVDGGIYLEGVFAWETDANCNVIAGSAVIFGFDLPISGAVNKDLTFDINHIGGPISGSVDGNNHITGKLMEGGGREWVHGVLNGTFTPNGHI